jgi:ubiquinone/menaquinone biosynthesis C-methylase UbiE
MGRKRRQVRLDDDSAWIFNRMAEVYDARPPYPPALLEALVALAGPLGARVLDVGAGIGHVALPLASHGLTVTAIEPARAMLDRLRKAALERGTALHAVHSSAESLPFEARCFDLVLIADALHFIDAELAATEIRRVLAPRGKLAIVTCEYAHTPFMNAVREIVDGLSDRRPRNTEQALRHLTALARTRLGPPRSFRDATPVDPVTLERILKSVSFIGPAMNSTRFAQLRERLHALSVPPVWSRTFTLHCAQQV